MARGFRKQEDGMKVTIKAERAIGVEITSGSRPMVRGTVVDEWEGMLKILLYGTNEVLIVEAPDRGSFAALFGSIWDRIFQRDDYLRAFDATIVKASPSLLERLSPKAEPEAVPKTP
jgi:hypothetical protein